jgi:5-methyltetrahydrofolate--homocysteine methyltransferase
LNSWSISTPFFRAWGLKGRYPDILDDAVVGLSAQSLWRDAQQLLKQLITEKSLTANGIAAFFPAYASGDDVMLFSDEQRSVSLGSLYFLRQQIYQAGDNKKVNHCLADFIAPQTYNNDYIGLFAVTAGVGITQQLKEYEAEHDHYRSVLLKAVADRLAEAFAERLHQRVRTEFWGYAADESFSNELLIKEQYQGIRPAPGYPACPDHHEKFKIFQLLNATEHCGIELTESAAMWPAASVSGYYFSHPQARYFGIGKITEDQLSDYAKRKNITLDDARRWLQANCL